MPRPVIIVDYDPLWPEQFEAERGRILTAIGERVLAVEHIGSTAVPGLGAKPVIDILAGVRQLSDADDCVAPLAAIGYQYYPQHEGELPDRRYFDIQEVDRDAHLHMVEVGGPFWERHIAFRDYLRAHHGVATEYERLKRDLAARYRTDRDGYTNAKTDFIQSIEAAAAGEKAAAADGPGPENARVIVVLAMHGSPPGDFPRRELAEFFTLRSRLEHSGAVDQAAIARHQHLEDKLLAWPRSAGTDPYWAGSQALGLELERASGMKVIVGFNEFCGPSLAQAIDDAAGTGARQVIVVTPMMTRGGEHTEIHIPRAVDQARERHPKVLVTYAWPFATAAVAGFLAAQVRRYAAPVQG